MSKIIGLDISKNWLDACIYESNVVPTYKRLGNNEIGHHELLNLLKTRDIALIICEPTGGYEEEICKKLSSDYKIHKVNTYSFNLFSKSVNLSKTDKQDAFKLAYYADKMGLKENYIYREEIEKIKRYQQRREDLVLILSNEKKRLHHGIDGIDKASIEDHINFLEKEILKINDKLDECIDSNKGLEEKVSILESVPGIGRCLATKLVSFLPELGDKNYTSNQLSAITGIAPYARDSGNKQGRRMIRGGRKIPRDALYMAILCGKHKIKYLDNVYMRLTNSFKTKKVAIVACMRKLLELCHKLLIQKRVFTL
jgi:transposase